MAKVKYTCPPQKPSGQSTFSDNLVGLQLVTGGGLTQGTFDFTTSTNEKTNRTFYTGNFSTPVNLELLGVNNVNESRLIFERNFKVYPNFDLSEVTNFTMFGSMTKRISTSIEKIISYFPAAIESTKIGVNYVTGETASNIVYLRTDDETKFDLSVDRIRNPFDIDFTSNSTRNLELRELVVSPLRDLTTQYQKYSLFLNDEEYQVTSIVPTSKLNSGTLTLFVKGNPFSGETISYDDLIIRPNDYEVNRVYNEVFDEVENFLLFRDISPIYTSTFKIPKENDDGTYFTLNQTLTWPLYGSWNLDILSNSFRDYLSQLNDISQSFDEYKTNLISRFFITDAFKEFDTSEQKVEKVLQIYGRSFDETKKFIDALAFMNSVNYNIGNDIPSQLLKNLSQTLGWTTNISPITNDDFLSSVFGQKKADKSQFTGSNKEKTPDELNYEYYRNLILNSAFLFKSKGTRKSIETLMRLIGAPDALIEFNEYVYLADQKIGVNDFNEQYAQISGGTYVATTPTIDSGNTFTIMGVEYTGYTTSKTINDVDVIRDEFPIGDDGFPKQPLIDGEYFFQKGSGWFESTPRHRSPEKVDLTNSVFTGLNPNYQTELAPFNYGGDYLNRFEKFPFTDLGFNLSKAIDNNKSWTDSENGLRSNLDSDFNAKYSTQNDKLVINVKNVDLFLNPSQGLLYDVWDMSNKFDYPIPNENYKTTTSSVNSGVDTTSINPQPRKQTFFEFAQSFWNNFINVRNRQYTSNGKTGGYPTLESIYWKYLESEENAGIPNDNFTYETMIKYVEGMGDYWIRLVEQMIPASTIWNTGVRYENSIFHRQKFVWRRQEGCQIIPIPCKPCSLIANIFTQDCPIQEVKCNKYPWTPQIQTFGGVLGKVLTDYLTSNGYELNDCLLNTLTTDWFVQIVIDGNLIINQPFFNGLGYQNPTLSSPTNSQWDGALDIALSDLQEYGYNYYYYEVENDFISDKVGIYNSICSISEEGVEIKINVGININILCS
jgi:hypothetical protein